jgi:hypothetical protein
MTTQGDNNCTNRFTTGKLTPPQQAPEIREDCEKNECKADAKHFQHCVDKVR